MSGDSSTTTIGSLACNSGRIVTVRILELITAGGLQRHTVIQKYYFCRTVQSSQDWLNFLMFWKKKEVKYVLCCSH